ncbi:MAG: hypothetical protein ACXAE3_02405 [Candidatus Kariarchaeaceae archaeon]|jgi:hypothetical protein
MMTKIPNGVLSVIEILQGDQIYTLEEIKLRLPYLDLGTVRYAIRRLLEIGIVQSIPDLHDMRTVKYRMESKRRLTENLDKLPSEIVKLIEPLL